MGCYAYLSYSRFLDEYGRSIDAFVPNKKFKVVTTVKGGYHTDPCLFSVGIYSETEQKWLVTEKETLDRGDVFEVSSGFISMPKEDYAVSYELRDEAGNLIQKLVKTLPVKKGVFYVCLFDSFTKEPVSKASVHLYADDKDIGTLTTGGSGCPLTVFYALPGQIITGEITKDTYETLTIVPWTFTVDDDGSDIEYDFTRHAGVFGIEVLETITGEPVKDAFVHLFANAFDIGTIKTDINGFAGWFPAAFFAAIEGTIAKVGYEGTRITDWHFSTDDDGKTFTYHLTRLSKFKVKVSDSASGNRVSGACVHLYADDKDVGALTTDGNGLTSWFFADIYSTITGDITKEKYETLVINRVFTPDWDGHTVRVVIEKICIEGDIKCVENDLHKCVDGEWVLEEANSPECGLPQCTEGETKCIGYNLYECVSSKWERKETNSVSCGYVPPPLPPCPIACVCMGTDLVDALGPIREFRDCVLRKTTFGREFIALYYNKLTPFLSPVLQRHALLKRIIRPFVRVLVWVAVHRKSKRGG